MRRSDPLRLPLWSTAVYAVLVGLVLMLPATSEAVFGRPALDPAVDALYGVALITIGVVFGLLAHPKRRSSSLLWAQIGGLVLSAAVMAAYWSTGEFTSRTILAPFLLNLLFAAWIGSQVVRLRIPDTQATGV